MLIRVNPFGPVVPSNAIESLDFEKPLGVLVMYSF